MSLDAFVSRPAVPEPWAEGDNIPWDDPAFSARMLREHLCQDHDAASRRAEIIDHHVTWIHDGVLSSSPARILDLGCGPGLYTSRLARLGHECVGIDYSPAAIAYARAQAEADDLHCQYLLGDIRTADYGSGFDLVMQIFGEINVFRREDAGAILSRARDAVKAGGKVLLEVHTEDAVRRGGEARPSWRSETTGLFSDRPHLCLEESFWHEEAKASTTRHIVIDAGTGHVDVYAKSMQAYTLEDYESLLAECGFGTAEFHPSLTGERAEQGDFFVVIGRKTR